MRYDSLIAVVGMDGLFPGAADLRTYWQNIVSKTGATKEVIANRWIADQGRMVASEPAPDRALSNRCCLVDRFEFDPSGLRLPPELTTALDPMYHMVLHVGRRAVSGPPRPLLNRQRTGVVLAAIALPTDASSAMTRDLYQAWYEKKLFGQASYRLPSDASKMASRVTALPAALLARALGLGGGSYTLDAACASSLYAVKLACEELMARRADAMLAGGVSRPDCLYTQVGFSQLRALSPTGRCAPFDHSADGLVVGEGAGILVLKRLEDAIADKDPIHGVIHGIGLSNDMRGNLLAPESNGQVRAMRAAYETAGWLPSDIDLVECHGAGTPVGDTTEVHSLCTLWGQAGWEPGQCAIGSVKSMIGHLLTAAGAAGIIKTLLALNEKTLPPSLNFECPPKNSPLDGSPFRVQTDAAPWPKRQGRGRRAAVSAFGFGGINGHLLLEEWETDHRTEGAAIPTAIRTDPAASVPSRTAKSAPPPAIAIVGMAAAYGSITSLKQFQEVVFNGRSIVGARPRGRWKGLAPLLDFAADSLPDRGGFMSHLDIGTSAFRIPPLEIPDILPQHLLMLQVAADAMADAGLSGVIDRPRAGAVIGIDFDFEATNFQFRWFLPTLVRQWRQRFFPDMDEETAANWELDLQEAVSPPLTPSRTLGALGGIVASRIAREFRFGGASFGVSAEAASGNRALEIGVRSLQRRESDVVLVGAVDLAGDIRQVLSNAESGLRSKKEGVSPFDHDADGTLPGEGAAALVIKRHDQAVADGDRIYALVSGIGHSCGEPDGRSAADFFSRALTQALQEAAVAPADIDYVETNAAGIPARDRSIRLALRDVFADNRSPCSLGTCVPNLGYAGAAAGLASVVKVALCLFHEIIPPLAGYRSPDQDDGMRGVLSLPNAPHYWFHDRRIGPRSACIGIQTADGNGSAAVLRQAPSRLPPSDTPQTASRDEERQPLGPAPLGLFVVQGRDREALLSAVERLQRWADRPDSPGRPVESAARHWLQEQPLDPSRTHTAVFLAAETAGIQTLAREARQAIKTATSLEFGTGGGVCYRETPLSGAELAFVYPGSGNHYPGMGREIAVHWPGVIRGLDAGSRRLTSRFGPGLCLPRGDDGRPVHEKATRKEPAADPLDTIIGPVAFGCLTTALMEGFAVKPQAVIGYSLGEVTGLIATHAWPDRDEVLERMLGTDLFHRQLSGHCPAARAAWALADEDEFNWRACVVNRPARIVEPALRDLPALRLLIVNTPDECVVGGDAKAIDTLVRRLDCQSIELEGVVTVHCDALAPVADAYRSLHVFPTAAPRGVRFYSCASGRTYRPTPDSAADSILNQGLNGFDFPRTIERAYADGVRIFLELGPGASCSRMIRRILGDRSHRSFSLDAHGSGGIESVLKGIGSLIAEGVAVDLQWLYPPQAAADLTSRGKRRETTEIRRVPVGGRIIAPEGPNTTGDSPDVKPMAASDSPAPSATRPTAPPTAAEEKRPAAGGRTIGAGHREPSPTTLGPGPGERFDPHRPLTAEGNGGYRPDKLIAELTQTTAATAAAHKQYLDFTADLSRSFAEAVAYHTRLVESLSRKSKAAGDEPRRKASDPTEVIPGSLPLAYDRHQCLEFATGKVAAVLGPEFAAVDAYRTRVRLPAEPLMLVDRILSVEGVKGSLSSGRLVTEHDVLPGAWYLDGGRAPVCIAVEAGQADLFLCAYLGIDLAVKGERVYRLLDASVVFHRDLPRPGETIRYEITIDKFIRQGQTYLFFFRFEGTIDNQPLISMTDGCAGFFTEEEIENSGGVIPTAEDREKRAGRRDPQWEDLVPQALESYDDDQLDALRTGDIGACFGPDFDGVLLPPSLRLPGGRMKLIDRVQSLDPHGGRFGLGSIRAEADIHPDDWFLTCHFVDDMTMPGTLMYECCAHTLRVFLQRMGWVTDRPDVRYESVPGIKSVLRCRGPVTPGTRQVIYEVEIKEIGYGPEPYALADAHMYADGRYIVRFTDMAIRMAGSNRDSIESGWNARRSPITGDPQRRPTPALFDRSRILAFCTGKPSVAFGDRYAVFDADRFIARLPAPPYSFIDRVIKTEPEAWKLAPGGWVETEFDVRPDDWYFNANRAGVMPYCVLLEIALQACGWTAAYVGSALRSDRDLRFRNLDGQATLHREVRAVPQTLTTRCRITKVSSVSDVIIESFAFQVLNREGLVYEGHTVFGFFTAESLADQKGVKIDEGLRGIGANVPEDSGPVVHLPDEKPLTPMDAGGPGVASGLSMPAKALRMIDRVDRVWPMGGPAGLGYLLATKNIDPKEWFFDAHFYKDPVCPGSLGIESFLQVLKYEALRRWGHLSAGHRFEPVFQVPHTWQYRGQIVPDNRRVEVEAFITAVKNEPAPELRADGILKVDGLAIYLMKDYGLRLVPLS